MSQTYYDLLEVSPDASQEDLKRAWRRLAREHHPDRNADSKEEAEGRFKEIHHAYSVLRDPAKRREYDRTIRRVPQFGVGHSNGGFTTFPYPDPFPMPQMQSMAEIRRDILKQLGLKNAPTHHTINTSLEEMYRGVKKKMLVRRQRFNDDGIGTHEESTTLELNIAPGCVAGETMVFEEQGDETLNGIAGDIVFEIAERRHDRFERNGDDLVTTVVMNVKDILLGNAVPLQTLDGREILVHTRGLHSSQLGQVLRGEGMPTPKTPRRRGDLIVRFDIVFPHFSDVQRNVGFRDLM